MAEGSTNFLNNVVCRFFATGTCLEGDKCPFTHDKSRPVHDTVCRYYLQGRCIYGKACRYDHVRLKTGLPIQNSKAETSHQVGESVRSSCDKPKPKLTDLKKSTQNFQVPNGLVSKKPMNSILAKYVNAPEFVPKSQKSYADTVKLGESSKHFPGVILDKTTSYDNMLCPYYALGDCHNPQCMYIHGDVCELCGQACLVPFDNEQQKKHREKCEKEIEMDMELSFAVQRSADKTCGICMDVIMEKETLSDRRFGILENCNHIFCLDCIRKWRQTKQAESCHSTDNVFDVTAIRGCPECRVPSDFITPSLYYIDDEDEKKKLIEKYKGALSKKPCKYFKKGEGNCPFGGACFYLHAYPDGTKAELPMPRRRRRQNDNGELSYMNRIMLYDFLELRDHNVIDDFDLEDILDDWSASDDSDGSVPFFFGGYD